MKRTYLGALAIASVGALALSACGGQSGSTGDNNSIKVGINFDLPGIGLHEGKSYRGLDPDVGVYVAQKLGKTPTFVEASSAKRAELLKSGDVDLVIATYSITDERKQEVTFAGPYFVAHQGLLVRKSDNSITGFDSLAGKKVCSTKGTTSSANITQKEPKAQIQEETLYSTCVNDLLAGKVDAVTTDDAILGGFAGAPQYKGKVKVVESGTGFSTEKYGIGIKKGDTQLCQQVNDALKEMISSGAWKKAVDKNIGATGFKPSSENPPAQEACS